MNFLKKLDWLMEQQRLNKHTLAQKCGVPYTTIVGLYERGPENARMSTLFKLADFFKVSIDYLVLDQYERPEDFVPNSLQADISHLSDDENYLLNLYRSMNQESKQNVIKFVELIHGNPESQEGCGEQKEMF